MKSSSSMQRREMRRDRSRGQSGQHTVLVARRDRRRKGEKGQVLKGGNGNSAVNPHNLDATPYVRFRNRKPPNAEIPASWIRERKCAPAKKQTRYKTMRWSCHYSRLLVFRLAARASIMNAGS